MFQFLPKRELQRLLTRVQAEIREQETQGEGGAIGGSEDEDFSLTIDNNTLPEGSARSHHDGRMGGDERRMGGDERRLGGDSRIGSDTRVGGNDSRMRSDSRGSDRIGSENRLGSDRMGSDESRGREARGVRSSPGDDRDETAL